MTTKAKQGSQTFKDAQSLAYSLFRVASSQYEEEEQETKKIRSHSDTRVENSRMENSRMDNPTEKGKTLKPSDNAIPVTNYKKINREERRKIQSVRLRKTEGLSREALQARKAILKTIRDHYDPLSPMLDQL